MKLRVTLHGERERHFESKNSPKRGSYVGQWVYLTSLTKINQYQNKCLIEMAGGERIVSLCI
jgi:hypothetical protein